MSNEPSDKPIDLEAIRAQLKALESSEDWAQGRVALTVSQTTRHNNGVWYDDGDLCAEVHDNLGLGMEGKAYAEFFAASVSTIPALLREVERLQGLIERALRRYDNPKERHNIIGGFPRGELAWAMEADLREYNKPAEEESPVD